MFKKILLLISILLFSIKAFSLDNTPSQVVKEFYTWYVKNYVKENTLLENTTIDIPEILTYVSKDFVKKNIGADEFYR